MIVVELHVRPVQ